MSQLDLPANALLPGDEIVGWRSPGTTGWSTPSQAPAGKWTIGHSKDGDWYDALSGGYMFPVTHNYIFRVKRGDSTATGEVIITANEIKVGDHVIGYQNPGVSEWRLVDWVIAEVPKPGRSYHITIKGESVIDTSYSGKIKVIRGTTKPKSQWNGKCLLCNKNTLTLFQSVEHEGGQCL